ACLWCQPRPFTSGRSMMNTITVTMVSVMALVTVLNVGIELCKESAFAFDGGINTISFSK
ncbi:MAG: hypothetical protein ACXVA0_24750, partial [Mucilaginibacter sp.]